MIEQNGMNVLKNKGIVMKFLIKYFMLTTIFVAPNIQSSDNVLQKVTHASQLETEPSLGKGEVTLCFSPGTTFVCHGEKKVRSKNQVTFFCPRAGFSVASDLGIKNIDRMSDQGYRIEIEKVTKPTGGIKVSVTYDPREVIFSYDPPAESRDLSNVSVVLNFYNKKIKEKIEKRASPVISTAWSDQGGLQEFLIV